MRRRCCESRCEGLCASSLQARRFLRRTPGEPVERARSRCRGNYLNCQKCVLPDGSVQSIVIFPRAASRNAADCTSRSDPRKSKYDNSRVCCGSSENTDAYSSPKPSVALQFQDSVEPFMNAIVSSPRCTLTGNAAGP